MATNQSNSKSNESVPTEATPSTGASLEESKAHWEAYRQKQEAQFVEMMGETEGKAYAAKVWARMWDEEEEECEECGEPCTGERCEECNERYEATANCRCEACGDCVDTTSDCLHEKVCRCEDKEES